MVTTMLYDEDCSLCVASAAWLGRRVAPERLRLVGLSDGPNDPIVGSLVDERQLADTLHVVTGDRRVLTGARAVLAAGRLVPRWRMIASLLDHRIGHAVLEPIYRAVAVRRRALGKILRLPATCPVPGANVRQI